MVSCNWTNRFTDIFADSGGLSGQETLHLCGLKQLNHGWARIDTDGQRAEGHEASGGDTGRSGRDARDPPYCSGAAEGLQDDCGEAAALIFFYCLSKWKWPGLTHSTLKDKMRPPGQFTPLLWLTI
jgi:hypothetical protein